MGKTIALLATLVVLVVVSGCDSSGVSEEENPPNFTGQYQARIVYNRLDPSSFIVPWLNTTYGGNTYVDSVSVMSVEDDGEYVSFNELICKATRHSEPVSNHCESDDNAVSMYLAPAEVMEGRVVVDATAECTDANVWIRKQIQQHPMYLETSPLYQIRFEARMEGGSNCTPFDVYGTLTRVQ
ncbi:MAG: hypothetical protein OXL40_13210 [Bacteroidota bacterium]|nr:hypothetical protein [Bacteroidota bacterium]